MDQCDFPKCRNLSYYGYIGRNICSPHWEELCLADNKTEKRLLKKIGLIRNKHGVVILVKDNK